MTISNEILKIAQNGKKRYLKCIRFVIDVILVVNLIIV